MGIFSNSIFNLLSKSKFTSNFCTNSSKSDNIKPKKLLVRRERKGSIYYTRISSTNGKNFRYEHLDFPNTVRSRYFNPRASCNSLLFASCIHKRLSSALWNPTTDEVKTLPKSSIPFPPLSQTMSLAASGLGFDPAIQDYKAVRFLQFRYDDYSITRNEIKAEIYSLKRDSWKEITYPHSVTPKSSFIDRHGFCYWPTSKFILSLDLANEKFSSTPLPKTNMLKIDERLSNILLAEFDGSLAALVYKEFGTPFDNEKRPLEFEIWVWKYEIWIRVMSDIIGQIPAPVNGIFEDTTFCARRWKPLGLFNNYELYLQHLESGELMVFDCSKRVLMNLGLKADAKTMYVLPCVESEEPITV